MKRIGTVSDDNAPVRGIAIIVVLSTILWLIIGEIGLAILE